VRATAPGNPASVTWSGTLTMSLPPR